MLTVNRSFTIILKAFFRPTLVRADTHGKMSLSGPKSGQLAQLPLFT